MAVQADGRPVGAPHLSGNSLDIGFDGITLNLDGPCAPLPEALIVGVRARECQIQYAGVNVLAAFASGNGRQVIHALFGGPADELLQPKNLTPRFHFDSMTFSLGFPASLIHSWEALGVLQPVVIDRLLLCPLCRGLPTMRSGCRHCGSGRIVMDRPERLRANRLTEAASGQPYRNGLYAGFWPQTPRAGNDTWCAEPCYRCQDCLWTDIELEPIHQCLHCQHRFAAAQAYEMVLQGYHADRLDPLAFCHAT
jgi:hypothetical protein